ncbi:unnamed protein product [Prorocentrum cordatum]|uniref:Uncharacterized protein n=1 Tax=Prorocentrum cordatum TaxID=2364126 RepID=A0ABN9PPA6_9DINO|nr:unnamed protein product [Polarella glacialis]
MAAIHVYYVMALLAQGVPSLCRHAAHGHLGGKDANTVPPGMVLDRIYRDTDQQNASHMSANAQAKDAVGDWVCTELVAVAGSQNAYTDFWSAQCQNIPENSDHMKVVMGITVDYFKPVQGASMCDMLTSPHSGSYPNPMFEWSNDQSSWTSPPNAGWNILGGSPKAWPSQNVPGDNRMYLSHWGGDAVPGGCCSSTYGSAASWGQSFTMSSCASTAPASATGDPHLQNLYGERFDLMQPGSVVLIQIPRGQPINDTLLTIEADARRLGAGCTDMYFQTLSVTGKWVGSVLRFDSQRDPEQKPKWVKFGPVELKVTHGRADTNFKYLNFYVKHLGHAGADVGGLLGMDDHTDAATPGQGCVKLLSLSKTKGAAVSSGASMATATSE